MLGMNGRWRVALLVALALLPAGSIAQFSPKPAFADRMSGDLVGAHDPSIIKQGATYYVFTTSHERQGAGLIHVRTSPDLLHWTRAPSVFAAMPEWTRKAVPGTVGIGAPDVAFVDGRYRVYYSVSTFGSNRSAIGLATSATLDAKAPGYGWRDEGEVIASRRSDDFNAIDPDFFVDRDGKHWLAFGSFWSGIKMVRLDPATGKRSAHDKTIYSLAQRPSPGAVEAPNLIEHGGYYYLFASYDFCCRAANSDYYTIVGRSKSVTGPYLDADGKPLLKGHGQVVLHARLDKTRRWRGPGHVSVLQDGQRFYIAYHTYDARNKGVSVLRISELGWSADGWPVAKF